MRVVLAALLLCLFIVPSNAQDDRYQVAYGGGYGADVVKSVRDQRQKKRIRQQRVPRQVQASVIGGRPSGCPPRAWCGCWLAKHLGMSNPRPLWLARNWSRVGANAGGPRPGTIVVWRHHVGKITAVQGNKIRVLSGNDGRAVRERWRTTAGVIAYRAI